MKCSKPNNGIYVSDMKYCLLLFLMLPSVFALTQDSLSIPEKNKRVLDYVKENGRFISPTYREAVCTEFVIGVLQHFGNLSPMDKVNIRIIIPEPEKIFELVHVGSHISKGVYFALISNGMGEAVDDWTKVLPGDFVQFWYEHWGHCGIVSSMDLPNKKMYLHSSFPSTDGYGIQEFDIPDKTWFVRLK